MDPRTWDLRQLLSAYEVTLQRGCKDEAEWNRIRSQLYAEPPEVKRERLRSETAAPTAARPGLTLSSVQALLAGAATQDAAYGSA